MNEENRKRLKQSRPGIERLLTLMEILRSPQGCPWDQKQTHRSLLSNLLEEAYEFIGAVNSSDEKGMIEELGDLLLQVVFHAQILKERGVTHFQEIAEKEVEKIVSRHPHVFGEEKVEDSEEVLRRWEARKEKDRKSLGDGIPPELPALMRAWKVGERAGRLGLDFKDPEEVWKKIQEELEELKGSIDGEKEGSVVEEELGDLLFAVVNLSRVLGISPEIALNRAVEKFVSRFDRMRKPQGSRLMGGAIQEEWDRSWEKVKKK
jgi:tetrapyrrole methylase family protein/MazG family protein